MTMPASSTRPATKSIGAAVVDLLMTLIIFVVVFLAFLIAPLVALALAYLGYAVMRSRGKKSRQSGSGGQSNQASHGFGSGTP